MKGKFCAICGTTKGPFVDNLCEKCYLKEYPPQFNPLKILNMTLCPICESVSVEGLSLDHFQLEETIDTIVRELARSKIIENLKIDVPYRIEFLSDDISEDKIYEGFKEFELITRIYYRINPAFSEHFIDISTKITINKTVCQQCVKSKSGYHEAILQVRGTNRTLTPQEEEKVKTILLNKLNNFGDPKTSYMFDYTVNKEGITAKISTKMLAEELAKVLKDKMNAKYSVAYTLVTQTRDGKDVYRNTYLVRLPEYIFEDIVEFQGKLWEVIVTEKEEVVLKLLENQEEHKVNRKKFEHSAKKRTDEIVKRKFMYITDEGEDVILMAMDNYENFEEKKKKLPPTVQLGQIIEGFSINSRSYYTKVIK